MSMLTAQCDELRDKAMLFEGYNNGEISRMLRDAADTIESLRDRLQELQGVGGESRYSELFGTPERTVRTLISVRGECDSRGQCYPNCPFGDAPTCPSNCESRDYDALLEWLRGDA